MQPVAKIMLGQDVQGAFPEMRGQRNILQLFLDMELAMRVEHLIAEGQAFFEAGHNNLVRGSDVGAQMFSQEAMNLVVQAFGQDITRRLVELELANYDLAELQSFRSIVMCAAERMDQEVFAESIDFCTDKVNTDLESKGRVAVCFGCAVVDTGHQPM